MDFIVKIYSTLKHIQQPDEIMINKNLSFTALVYAFLAKNNLHLIDFNLIKVYRIDNETSKKSFHLMDIHKSHVVFDNQIPEYYFSVEEGICIKVNIIVDTVKNYDRYISISSVTTAIQLFNMLIKEFSLKSTTVCYNLFHNSGKLKPSDLPVLAIQITGSNEFLIEFNQNLPNEEIIEKEILKQLSIDYKISSPKNNYHVSKSVNNLSKVPYYNSDRKYQRKLPQLSNFRETKNKYFDEINDKISHLNYNDKSKKRSLPTTPNMSLLNDETCCKESSYSAAIDMMEKEFNNPPEPVIKTNAIIDERISSSSRSISSSGSFNNDESERKLSNSVIPRQYSTELEVCSPNLYHVVKYCNLISIELSIKSNVKNPFPIKLKEDLFQTYKITEDCKPGFFKPILECNNDDSFNMENGNGKLNSSIIIIDNFQKNDLDLFNYNIKIGDILVNIDNENVLNKQKEYIYSKLTRNVKHEIIIARYKYLRNTSHSEKKDQKIIKLKRELENLKQKYLALHNVTVGNNQIIQQLNKELQNKRSTIS